MLYNQYCSKIGTSQLSLILKFYNKVFYISASFISKVFVTDENLTM
jgi:hypothetical protein